MHAMRGLHWCAKDGDIEQVKQLIQNGAEVNSQNGSGRTALHKAAAKGHEDIIRELIRGGVNLNIKTTKYEYTAVWVAIQKDKLETALLLLAQGADPLLESCLWIKTVKKNLFYLVNATIAHTASRYRQALQACYKSLYRLYIIPLMLSMRRIGCSLPKDIVINQLIPILTGIMCLPEQGQLSAKKQKISPI